MSTLFRVTYKNVIAVAALLVGGAALSACEDHYTTQEAYSLCEDLQGSSPTLDFDDCVDCHERCGADCEAQGTSPETFACPDDGAGGAPQ
ncbi:MAG: hypothetical protein U0271_38775 [Polyangiaceae bacterium]